jgi:hypothetical protein
MFEINVALVFLNTTCNLLVVVLDAFALNGTRSNKRDGREYEGKEILRACHSLTNLDEKQTQQQKKNEKKALFLLEQYL